MHWRYHSHALSNISAELYQVECHFFPYFMARLIRQSKAWKREDGSGTKQRTCILSAELLIAMVIQAGFDWLIPPAAAHIIISDYTPCLSRSGKVFLNFSKYLRDFCSLTLFVRIFKLFEGIFFKISFMKYKFFWKY